MIGSRQELSFVLVAVSVILASITPFQLQLTAATLASSTNQLNATVGPTPPFMKLFQNSTNSSLVVGDTNATNLTQKQELIDQPSSIQTQQQLPLSQSQPQPLQEQTVPLPEFKPKPRENLQGSSDQFSMTVQFQPYRYGIGWYQVSDWQLSLSYPNRWCPIQDCTFQLSLGYLGPGESSRGGGHFFGLLETNSGDTMRTSNLEADWTAVEERIQGGQTVQVIDGTLTLTTYVASFPTDN